MYIFGFSVVAPVLVGAVGVLGVEDWIVEFIVFVPIPVFLLLLYTY